MDARRQGLDEAGLDVAWSWGLAVGLIQGGPQVSHGALLDLGPRSLRDLGHVATEDSPVAAEVHWALAV